MRWQRWDSRIDGLESNNDDPRIGKLCVLFLRTGRGSHEEAHQSRVSPRRLTITNDDRSGLEQWTFPRETETPNIPCPTRRRCYVCGSPKPADYQTQNTISEHNQRTQSARADSNQRGASGSQPGGGLGSRAARCVQLIRTAWGGHWARISGRFEPHNLDSCCQVL